MAIKNRKETSYAWTASCYRLFETERVVMRQIALIGIDNRLECTEFPFRQDAVPFFHQMLYPAKRSENMQQQIVRKLENRKIPINGHPVPLEVKR